MAALSGILALLLFLIVLTTTTCYSSVVHQSKPFRQLPLPPPAPGVAALGFPSYAQVLVTGFYAAVTDGRIMRYNPNTGWMELFALTSPNWSPPLCVGTRGELGEICGRPVQLVFDRTTGRLFITDAYYGLFVVDLNGGFAQLLVNTVKGQPLFSTHALDIDEENSLAYFTELSSTYTLRNLSDAIRAKDSTGRLLKYDPETKKVTVLMRNLSLPTGLAVSYGGTYLLVSEYGNDRIIKFWLIGPNANTSEILISSIRRPNNIRQTLSGQYLIAASLERGSSTVPIKVRVDGDGTILKIMSLETQFGNTPVTEVQEAGSAIYAVSQKEDFIAIFNKTTT